MIRYGGFQNKERIYSDRLSKKYPKTYAKLKNNPYVFPSREGRHIERDDIFYPSYASGPKFLNLAIMPFVVM